MNFLCLKINCFIIWVEMLHVILNDGEFRSDTIQFKLLCDLSKTFRKS